MSVIFFRNDDVRSVLDDSLVSITNLFVDMGIPITHGVEPANVSKEVSDWLASEKNKHPDLIEIIQHGYDHKVKNTRKKGEFGGQRTFEEQYRDICKGKKIMSELFGDQWFPAFCFPYAPYNRASMRALDECGFKVVNSHFNRHWTRKIFYFLGHCLGKGMMLGRHVSWNLDYYPDTRLFEVDMNIGFIKRYIDEKKEAEMMNMDEMISATENYSKYPVIGVLIHHRYHDNKGIDLIKNYISYCVEKKFEFMSIRQVYERFAERKNEK